MIKSALIRRNAPDEMECGACGGAMRLYGIEAHPAIAATDLQTYVCLRCDHVQTQAVPAPGKRKGAPMNGHAQEDAFDAETTRLLGAAFDAAWEAVW